MAAVWWAVACAAHLGFQATVTLLVYPQLAAVPERDWRSVHAAHGRRITPLVGVTYVGMGAAGLAVLLTGATPLLVTSLGSASVAVLVTATLAAPLHGRLDGPDPVLLRRLRTVDGVRLGAAVLAAATAAIAAVTA